MKRRFSMRTPALALAAAALLALAACEKAPSTPQKPEPASTSPAPAQPAPAEPAAPAQASPASAEQTPFLQAVVTYLETEKGMNTSMMNIEMKDLKVEGTKATATVTYTAKKGEMPPMVYRYEFAQENGTWKALSSAPEGGSGHGGMTMPPGEGMPAGHPPVGMPAHGEMPADHPPVSNAPAK